MTELSRSLLAAARDGLAPDAAVAARVRAKVAASIAAGAAATAVATHSASSAAVPAATASSSAVASTTAPAATASSAASTAAVTSSGSGAGSASLILRLGAALLVVGAITTSALVTRDRGSVAPHLSMTSSADLDEPHGADRRVSHDDSANAGSATAGAPTAAFETATGAASSPTRPIASSNAHRAVAIESSAIEIDVPRAAEPVSLSREVELIDLAMASLRKHAPAAALAAIHTFDRETLGQGQMAEEAAAIAIEARCGLHQDVTEPLAAFDRAWPSSAQRSRVVTTCFAK